MLGSGLSSTRIDSRGRIEVLRIHKILLCGVSPVPFLGMEAVWYLILEIAKKDSLKIHGLYLHPVESSLKSLYCLISLSCTIRSISLRH